MKLDFKYSNTKFNDTPSSTSRVVPCGRESGQTHMTKLTVRFHSFMNAPKMYLNLKKSRQLTAHHLIPCGSRTLMYNSTYIKRSLEGLLWLFKYYNSVSTRYRNDDVRVKFIMRVVATLVN